MQPTIIVGFTQSWMLFSSFKDKKITTSPDMHSENVSINTEIYKNFKKSLVICMVARAYINSDIDFYFVRIHKLEQKWNYAPNGARHIGAKHVAC